MYKGIYMLERTISGQMSPSEITQLNLLKERSIQYGKPMVLWGWKRDKILNGVRHPESRTVYFSADLKVDCNQIRIDRAFFFLETRAKKDEILKLYGQVDNNASSWNDKDYEGYARLRIIIGEPTDYDIRSVNRRLKGKPRISIYPPKLVPESHEYDLSDLAPMTLCVGSGLSAESGLPLLGAIHNLFEVDNMVTGELIFGAADTLPKRIDTNQDQEFQNFCQFTIDALKAEPSDSHKLLADLYKAGIVRQVFTDNMDDILAKVNVPYVRTRQGIFPDRYPVKFDSKVKSLLVIGVAVDRRDVIKQARAAGLKIIAINPVFGVAPHSRNMDYLSRGDIFYRQTTSEALPKIIQASGFGKF